MIDLKAAADHFKDHVATFKDYGDIKILDFKKPESEEYHIFFTFFESYGAVHIDGDLGFLAAVQRGSMTYDNFSSYSSPEYFEEKVQCHSRPFYEYDEELARKELKEWIGTQDYPEEIEEAIDEIMEGFDDETGISQDGWDRMMDIDPDAWEVAGDIGKKRTGIVELYLLAFKLAKKQIETKKSQTKTKPIAEYNGTVTKLVDGDGREMSWPLWKRALIRIEGRKNNAEI